MGLLSLVVVMQHAAARYRHFWTASWGIDDEHWCHHDRIQEIVTDIIHL